MRARAVIGILSAMTVLSQLIMTPLTAKPGRTIHSYQSGDSFFAVDSASVLIRFPDQIPIEDLDIRVAGAGRVKGYFLRKVGTYEQEADRPYVEDVTIGQCASEGCSGAKRSSSTRFDYRVGKGLRGVWEMTIVADGTPVTISFGRPASRDALRADEPANDEIVTLTPRADENGGQTTLYSAGDFSALPAVDYGLVGLWALGDPGQAIAWGLCSYTQESMPPDAAFLPGCGGPRLELPSPSRHGIVRTSSWQEDVRGLGAWFLATPNPTRFGAVGYWIDF